MQQKINILTLIFILFSLSVFSQQYSTKKKKAIAQFELARRSYDMGDLKDAESQLNKAIKIDKKFIEAYLLKAQLYLEIGNFKKEAEIYECALEIKPDFSPKVYYLLAVSYFNNEEYKKSVEKAQKGIEMPSPSHQLSILLKKVLEGAKFAANLYEHPVPFKPINMGKMYSAFELFLDINMSSRRVTLPEEDDISEIDGLNVEEGINYANGNPAIYMEVLNEFLEAYGDSGEAFEKLVKENRNEQIKMLSLDMKGLTGAIGAYKMFELVDTMHKQFLYNNIHLIPKFVESYELELEKLIMTIHEYMDEVQ